MALQIFGWFSRLFRQHYLEGVGAFCGAYYFFRETEPGNLWYVIATARCMGRAKLPFSIAGLGILRRSVELVTRIHGLLWTELNLDCDVGKAGTEVGMLAALFFRRDGVR